MELINSTHCMTLDIGVNGNMFGGRMLALMDQAGAIFAGTTCKTPRIVTKKMAEVNFLVPVKVNNIIKIYGEVVSIGKSSIVINLEARKINVYTSEEVVVCTTQMIFVRIDEDGKAIPISDHVREQFSVPPIMEKK